MYSDKVKSGNLYTALSAFAAQAPSAVSHHGKHCCHMARDWFLAMDRSELICTNSSFMPLWIQEHYKWGPNIWPLHWCEAINAEMLDCGGLAALTRESLKARGVTALATQIVLLYSQQNCIHWAKLWSNQNMICNWIVSPYVYHEVCAVLQNAKNEIRMWDPSDNSWIDPDQQSGYARPAAIRILALDARVPAQVRWGEHKIDINQWQVFLPSQN